MACGPNPAKLSDRSSEDESLKTPLKPDVSFSEKPKNDINLVMTLMKKVSWWVHELFMSMAYYTE